MASIYSSSSHASVPSFPAIAHLSAASIQAPLRKSAWQHEVAQSDLPFNTKGLLLLISVEWMDAQGGSCFPSEQQIMAKAGISRPALTGHIHRAADAGFIEVTHYGRGLKNRRYNYQARLPGELAPPLVVEEGKESFPSCPGEGKESFASLTIPNLTPTIESTPYPAPPPEPAPVVHSQDLRTIKTAPPDGLPESWVEQGRLMRPDLDEQTIRNSGAIFLDTARANGRQLVDWQAGFNAWLRRERTPKALPMAHKALTTPTLPSPYAGPNFGTVAQETAEEAAAKFAAQMARYGAVPGEGGTWSRPGAAVPVTPQAPAPMAAADPLPLPLPLPLPRPRPQLTADQTRRLAELAAALGRG